MQEAFLYKCHNYLYSDRLVIKWAMNVSGAKIKFYRQLKKIGQTELAGKVGITSQYLSKIECGKQMPSLQVLLLIAEKLEIDAAALISDSVV